MQAVKAVGMADVKSVRTKVTGIFHSFTTKKGYNHNFDYNDKCWIYLFSCITCSKQYTGKTTDRVRYWWNIHKMEARKAENGDLKNVKQKFLQNQFSQDVHKGFLEDVEVRRIDKTARILLDENT